MKKIFSILLTTALLSGMLLPMAVSANTPASVTISASQETRIEFEDYKDSFVTADGTATDGAFAELTADAKSSNGYHLLFNANTTTTAAHAQVEIPVYVAESGTYTITIQAARSNGSRPNLYVDNTQVTNYTNSQVGAQPTLGLEFTPYDWIFTANLTVGQRTIKVTPPTKAYSGQNAIKNILDCMVIRNRVAQLDTTTATTVEFEDFKFVSDYDYTDVRCALNDAAAFKTSGVGVTSVNVRPGSNGLRYLSVVGLVPNEYPYKDAPSVIAGKAEGDSVQKLNAAHTAFESHDLTQDEIDAVKANIKIPGKAGNLNDNPLYSGYVAIKVPIKVKTAGTYTFDLTRLASRFNGKTFVFNNGQTVTGSQSSGASAVFVYRGDQVDETKLIGQTHRYSNNMKDIGDQPHSSQSNGNFGTFYCDYFCGDTTSATYSGSKDSMAGKYVFTANLTTADTYLTFAIRPFKYDKGDVTTLSANDAQLTAFLDCVKISGSNVPNAISTTTRTGSVNYEEAERLEGINEAVLALYNKGALVSVEKWNNRAEKTMSFETAYTDTFDEAKIFMWEDYVDCIPKVAVKVLTVNN